MAVDRATGDLSAYPDLVMILLGMRVNTATGVKTLLGFGPRIAKVAKMSRMVFCLTKPSCGHCSRRTPASVSTGGTSRHWRLGLAQNPIGRGGRVSSAILAAPASGTRPISCGAAWWPSSMTFQSPLVSCVSRREGQYVYDAPTGCGHQYRGFCRPASASVRRDGGRLRQAAGTA